MRKHAQNIVNEKATKNGEVLYSERNEGGWKTQGRGKHTIKPLPKNGFGAPPPTDDTISTPLCSRPVILLRGNRHRPDKSHFLRPPKVVLEGALYSTFPPPKSHDMFCPHLRFPNLQLRLFLLTLELVCFTVH